MQLLITISLCQMMHSMTSLHDSIATHACNEIALRTHGYSDRTLNHMTTREMDIWTLHRAIGADGVSYEFMQKQLARIPTLYAIVCHEQTKEIVLVDTRTAGMVARYQVLSNGAIVHLDKSIAKYCHGKYRVFVDYFPLM